MTGTDEFLRYVVRKLAGYPEEVVIDHREEGGKITYLLSMRREDVGRLIGKGGATIRAIRDLAQASAEKHGKKVAVEILE
jgi:predicted RNA-binding protein YlqC (UPF0109 family)